MTEKVTGILLKVTICLASDHKSFTEPSYNMVD